MLFPFMLEKIVFILIYSRVNCKGTFSIGVTYMVGQRIMLYLWNTLDNLWVWHKTEIFLTNNSRKHLICTSLVLIVHKVVGNGLICAKFDSENIEIVCYKIIGPVCCACSFLIDCRILDNLVGYSVCVCFHLAYLINLIKTKRFVSVNQKGAPKMMQS